MRFFLLLLVFVLLTGFQALSQEDNNYIEKKNSISINLFGTSGIAGFTYERLLSNKIGVEAGVGLFGFGAGAIYYPFSIRVNKINPFVGVKYNHIILLTEQATYIPVGVSFISKWNMNIGADIGIAKYHKSKFNKTPYYSFKDSDFGYLWNVKIGYRF